MRETPIPFEVVRQKIKNSGIPVIGKGAIREIVRVVNQIETETGQKFIRMEMGVPGLNPPQIGTDAEIEALKRGVASKYPMIEGVDVLKKEFARFVKLFLNINIDEECCIPTVGSMQGAMICFLTANRTDKEKEGTLFIDPGFPVQKQQVRVLGHSYRTFDVYDFRGEKLRDKLDEMLADGKVSTILYSNPNNPSWICFSEKELQIIGEMANKYDVIVLEDLAYFGMDFRKDYSQPGKPPYQPTVANYTDNYVLLVSSSKSFSYAGQRIGMLGISNQMFNRTYPDLKRFYSSDKFGYCIIYGALYALSSGVSHSAQYGLAAMFKAANDGKFNFVEDVREYERRAKEMKKIFTDNGFKIVYDKDENVPVGDGFYFTFSYPNISGVDLVEELLYYGVSAIALITTGSERTEGLRACVSQTHPNTFPILAERLRKFNEDHKNDNNLVKNL